MKRCAAALVIMLLLTSIGTADDALWQDFTKLIVGDWTGYGTILAEGDGGPLKRGDKFTLRGSYRKVANGKAVLGTQILTVDGSPARSFDCTVTFGWDPVDKTIEVDAYWSEGAVERITLSAQKNDSFVGTYTIHLPTGKEDSADVVVKTTGNDKFAWTFTSGANAGETLSTWERIDNCADEEKYVTLWRDYFQGEWNTTIVKGEESGTEKTGTKGVWICQQHPTKNSMIFRSIRNGSPVYNGIAGYDPKSRSWKEVFFWADGSLLIQHYQASSDELDANSVGQVLKGQAEYIYSDGRIELAEIGVKVLSRNKCEYYVVNRRVAGEVQTDLLFAFERSK